MDVISMTNTSAAVIEFHRRRPTSQPQPRTRQEIEDLKDEWLHDPFPRIDLENTPGFEAHKDELELFRLEQDMLAEQRGAAAYAAKIEAVAHEIGCPDNLQLAEVVYHLRQRIAALETEA